MRAPFSTAVAIAIGFIILIGYFIPVPQLQQIRSLLLSWGIILAGFAALIGIVNLIKVHWQKIQSPDGIKIYSLVLILAFLATFGAGIWFTPADSKYQQAVLSVITPVEISLMAILAISLAYAGLRLLQHRQNFMVIIFFFSTIFFLFLLAGLGATMQDVPILGGLFAFISRLPLAGARGILLGIALGTLTTGLRIILGADRPYSG